MTGLRDDPFGPPTSHGSQARVWEKRALIAELALRNILDVRLERRRGVNAHNVARQQMRRIARDAFEEMDPWYEE